MSHGTVKLKSNVMIISSASVVGRDEAQGPLGAEFDICDREDDSFGMSTWEKSESEMQNLALGTALEKASLEAADIDGMLAGDLLNQCVGSNYGLSRYKVPYLGLYGACSTAAEGMLLASLLCCVTPSRYAAVTSSHYCSAERQFRFPLEYGGQRTPTSQWTVTGAGAFILSSKEADVQSYRKAPRVTEVMAGYVTDRGIDNINNMGAAMAPAAADTLLRYFSDGHRVEDYDMIVTGDLGREGSGILTELLQSEGIDIRERHVDCGNLIYNAEQTDKHAGGSGCGCSAVVMAANILKNVADGRLRDVLFVGTGALMNPLVLNQGSTIPGIGHLLHISGGEQ